MSAAPAAGAAPAAPPKKRIIIVGADEELNKAIVQAAEARGTFCEVTTSYEDIKPLWARPETKLLGVVADLGSLAPEWWPALLALHNVPEAPQLLKLDAPGTAATTDFIERTKWPLTQAFFDSIRQQANRPHVILCDQTLFSTGMLQAALNQAGLAHVPLETTIGLAEALSSPDNSLWGVVSQQGGPRVIAVSWRGSVPEAEEIATRVRQGVPQVRFLSVLTAGPLHLAELSIRHGKPASLPRELAETVPTLLEHKPAADPTEKGRVLLVENNQLYMVQLAMSLMAEGFEVAATTKAEEAFSIAENDQFYVALVGAAIAFAKHTGIELAQKLREIDPDLRLILMVDRFPAEAALRGVSQAVEFGLDDCLLKPAEPARVRAAIQRAIERRKLLMENARLLTELAVSNDKLTQLNGFQQKFFATVAHDVKNPLTAIRGYAELMGWKVKEPDVLKCVGHIQTSAKALEGLVSDLVDYAAIESGKLRVNLASCNLLQTVDEVCSRIEVVANQRKQKFIVNVPPELPTLLGDGLRLGQVIQNLCTNAVQYTPEGGSVTLAVEQAADIVTVSVRDTGIGISKEDLPRVFQRFFQTEAAQRMRRAGFGLGLKIAQEIVKTHGGAMGVESEVGKGSRFFFTIPVPATPLAAADATGAPVGAVALGGPATPAPRQIVPAPAPTPTPTPQPKAPAPVVLPPQAAPSPAPQAAPPFTAPPAAAPFAAPPPAPRATPPFTAPPAAAPPSSFPPSPFPPSPFAPPGSMPNIPTPVPTFTPAPRPITVVPPPPPPPAPTAPPKPSKPRPFGLAPDEEE